MTNRIFLGLLLVATIGDLVAAQNRTHRRRGIILGGLAGAALGVAIGDKGDNETAGALIGAAAGAFAGGAIGNQKDQRLEQEKRWREGFYGNEIPGPHRIQTQRYNYDSTRTLNHTGQPPHTRQFFQPRLQPRTDLLPAYNPPYMYPRGHHYLAGPNAEQAVGSFGHEAQAPRQAVIPPNQSVSSPDIDDVLEMQRSGVNSSLVLRQIQNHGFRGHLRVADIILLHKSGVPNDVIEAMQIYSESEPSTNFPSPPMHDPMSNSTMEDLLPPPAAPSR